MATGRMNRRLLFTAAIGAPLAAAALLRPSGAIAADGEIALDKVPEAVTRAASQIAPNAKWSEAYQETEDGKVVYQLDGEEPGERDVTVEVTAEGKVTMVETEIDLADVPRVVTAAASAKLPKFQATAAYAIRRGADLARAEPSERAFALDGTEGNDREVSIETTPEGKITSLEREIEVADVPAVVMDGVKKQMPMFRATAAHEIHEGESLTGYVLDGIRGGKGKKAKANAEVTVFASADGKEVVVAGP
jgi:hypothetical protein